VHEGGIDVAPSNVDRLWQTQPGKRIDTLCRIVLLGKLEIDTRRATFVGLTR
jgi:hypothetical protein